MKARAYKKQRNRAVTENYADLVPATWTQMTNIALFRSGQTSYEAYHIYDASELHSVTQDYLILVLQTDAMRPKHAASPQAPFLGLIIDLGIYEETAFIAISTAYIHGP